MTKKWYESRTIQYAIYSYIIAMGTLGYNAYQRGELTEPDIAAFAAATYTLKETIEGRKRATESISSSSSESVVSEKVLPIESPDINTILSLPSEESPYEEERDTDEESFQNKGVEGNSEEGELEISLIETLQHPYRIRVFRETKIKTAAKDSQTLSLEEYKTLEEDDSFSIVSWSFIDASNHIKVKLKEGDTQEYYLFVPHIKLFNPEGKEISIEGADPNFVLANKTPFRLPGYSSTFYLEDSIIPGGHFYWREATKNGTRIPENKTIVDNVIAIAKKLEDVRKLLGNRPITITSWYRPPHVNRAVGGASRSKHLGGGAVDIIVHGLSARKVQETLRSSWTGGIGLANTFTHLDLGPKRSWRYN